MAKDLNLSTSGLSTSVLGDADVPADWAAGFASGGVTGINLDGAIVRTVIRGQQWKLITKSEQPVLVGA